MWLHYDQEEGTKKQRGKINFTTIEQLKQIKSFLVQFSLAFTMRGQESMYEQIKLMDNGCFLAFNVACIILISYLYTASSFINQNSGSKSMNGFGCSVVIILMELKLISFPSYHIHVTFADHKQFESKS